MVNISKLNRRSSGDFSAIRRQLSIGRLEVAAGNGNSYVIDQEYFHGKLRHFTRTEAQHAVQVKEKEEECRRLEGQLKQFHSQHNRLIEDLDFIRKVIIL